MKTPQKPLFLQFSKATTRSTPSIVQMKKKHEKKPFPIPKVYGKEEKELHRIELNAIHV